MKAKTSANFPYDYIDEIYSGMTYEQIGILHLSILYLERDGKVPDEMMKNIEKNATTRLAFNMLSGNSKRFCDRWNKIAEYYKNKDKVKTSSENNSRSDKKEPPAKKQEKKQPAIPVMEDKPEDEKKVAPVIKKDAPVEVPVAPAEVPVVPADVPAKVSEPVKEEKPKEQEDVLDDGDIMDDFESMMASFN